MTKPLTWPDFSFPPINLYTIGPAYFEDSRTNSISPTYHAPFSTYRQYISNPMSLLSNISHNH